MEAIAKQKYLKGSPRKARLVIDLIRGRNVSQALAILKFTNKRAAQPIAKCLNSAIANATYIAEQQNIAIDPDDLWVKTCFVDMGPTKNRRRMRPAPQGRAYREQRHYCHITIEVSSEDQPKPEVQKNLGGKEADSSAGDGKSKDETKSSKQTEKKDAAEDVKETKAEEAGETAEPKEAEKAKQEEKTKQEEEAKVEETEETEETATDTPVAASEPTSTKPDAAAEQEAENEAHVADAKDATSQTPAEKNPTKPADEKQQDINEELKRQ